MLGDMKIKYLAMDVDGTLTDGKIYMSPSGEAMKAFSIKDGCGIHDLLLPAGITPLIITGRVSEIVINRCREIGIENVYQGVDDKLEKLKEATGSLAETAYIGDDINDLSCMTEVKKSGGLAGCPADAAKQVSDIADFISRFRGGDGAVRDFIEYIIARNNGQFPCG